jgi:hypothetical protein
VEDVLFQALEDVISLGWGRSRLEVSPVCHINHEKAL